MQSTKDLPRHTKQTLRGVLPCRECLRLVSTVCAVWQRPQRTLLLSAATANQVPLALPHAHSSTLNSYQLLLFTGCCCSCLPHPASNNSDSSSMLLSQPAARTKRMTNLRLMRSVQLHYPTTHNKASASTNGVQSTSTSSTRCIMYASAHTAGDHAETTPVLL